MTDNNQEWLSNRVLYLKGLKSRNEQQNILIALFENECRTPQDDKRLAVLVKAEKAADRAMKARIEANKLIQSEKNAEKKAERKARDHELYNSAGLLILAGLVDTKTGKPMISKSKLLGALLGLAKVSPDNPKWNEWDKEGAALLAKKEDKEEIEA